MKNKHILLIVFGCIVAYIFVCFIGCASFCYCVRSQFPQPSTTAEAKEWFEDEYGYPITISRDYALSEDDFGYMDRVWTAHIEEYPDVEFEIKCNAYSGTLSADYDMTTNFSYIFGSLYFEEYKKNHNTILFVPDEPVYFRFDVAGYYTDKTDIRRVAEELESFGKYLEEQPIKIDILYCLWYQHTLLDSPINKSAAAELFNEYNADVLYDTAVSEYIYYCTQHQICMDEFSQDECIAAITAEAEPYRFHVQRPDGTTVQYPDLVCREYAGGLSFGTIYEVLHREGYPTLTGTPEHFVLTGIDGNTYEFSYAFIDADKPDDYGDKHDSYYYLKNNERIYPESYWHNSLCSDELKLITGYSFVEEWRVTMGNDNKLA